MYSPQLFREKRRAPETIAIAVSKHRTWLDISMRCRWSVTMETDTYHSGCLTHPLAETERCQSRQSRIKMETTPEVHAGPAEQRGRGTQDGRMDGRADRRWQTEWKERKVQEDGEQGEKGRDQGGKMRPFLCELMNVWQVFCQSWVWSKSIFHLLWVCRGDAVSSLQILYPRQQSHVNHDPCH